MRGKKLTAKLKCHVASYFSLLKIGMIVKKITGNSVFEPLNAKGSSSSFIITDSIPSACISDLAWQSFIGFIGRRRHKRETKFGAD